MFKGPQITAKHVESTWQQTGHAYLIVSWENQEQEAKGDDVGG